MLRRLEAEEDAAEAGAEVAEDSVEGEEVEASEGVGVAEVSEEGVEDKLLLPLSEFLFFSRSKIS